MKDHLILWFAWLLHSVSLCKLLYVEKGRLLYLPLIFIAKLVSYYFHHKAFLLVNAILCFKENDYLVSQTEQLSSSPPSPALVTHIVPPLLRWRQRVAAHSTQTLTCLGTDIHLASWIMIIQSIQQKPSVVEPTVSPPSPPL